MLWIFHGPGPGTLGQGCVNLSSNMLYNRFDPYEVLNHAIVARSIPNVVQVGDLSLDGQCSVSRCETRSTLRYVLLYFYAVVLSKLSL